ncbi:MAG: ribonuclease E/G, partial [Gammaproteobacteria bacterium]
MKEEILINVTPREVRVALVDNGVLQEMLVERASRRGLLGNIYMGRIQRVLPGMQAAFVDVGLSRTAFLHASNIHTGVAAESGESDIRKLVHEGQKLLVQVEKEPMGDKGARLTTFVTIPSRYLVLMPGGASNGISSRIDDEAERQRLRKVLDTISNEEPQNGFIVRTAAEGASESTLRDDARFLQKLWAIVIERAAAAKPGELVHEDLP